MTTNQLIENINNKIHEFGFGYVIYHSLMEDISECIKEYEISNKKKSKIKYTCFCNECGHTKDTYNTEEFIFCPECAHVNTGFITIRKDGK